MCFFFQGMELLHCLLYLEKPVFYLKSFLCIAIKIHFETDIIKRRNRYESSNFKAIFVNKHSFYSAKIKKKNEFGIKKSLVCVLSMLKHATLTGH